MIPLQNLDKIYEARHKLLNLPQCAEVEAQVPPTYFSSIEQDFNTSALVEILSSAPNSPLTPGVLLQNFTPTFPNPSFQNHFGYRIQDFSNLTPANLRYHALQQQVTGQNLATGVANTIIPSYANSRPSVSPRSTNTNSSGYLSHASNICNISSSSNSLEQLYAPYKPTIQINGNGFSQSDNPIFICSSANNISRQLTDSSNNPFESENRTLTPNYHTVSENNQRLNFLK